MCQDLVDGGVFVLQVFSLSLLVVSWLIIKTEDGFTVAVLMLLAPFTSPPFPSPSLPSPLFSPIIHCRPPYSLTQPFFYSSQPYVSSLSITVDHFLSTCPHSLYFLSPSPSLPLSPFFLSLCSFICPFPSSISHTPTFLLPFLFHLRNPYPYPYPIPLYTFPLTSPVPSSHLGQDNQDAIINGSAAAPAYLYCLVN